MTRLEIMKFHVRRIATDNGTDPEIADRHDEDIAALLGDVPVNPGLVSLTNYGVPQRPPMMRPRSTFEVYQALLEIEASA